MIGQESFEALDDKLENPYSGASCNDSAIEAVFHITFFGTHPTLTHVPKIHINISKKTN